MDAEFRRGRNNRKQKRKVKWRKSGACYLDPAKFKVMLLVEKKEGEA